MSTDGNSNDNNDHDDESTEGELSVDNDGRALFSPDSRWPDDVRELQRNEAIYIIVLLLVSLLAIAAFGIVSANAPEYASVSFLWAEWPIVTLKYGFLAAGGLLGGTVYGAKWLYHSVAKGLWHKDRRMWRLMQPWISLGTTVGIWALIDSGFFTNAPRDISMLGIGFVVGYLSDRFLAKMKELTNVLFGSTERHFKRTDRISGGED